MSIQSDLVTALAGVASGNVFPEFLPEDSSSVTSYVIVRRKSFEPIMLLSGPSGEGKSTFIFECYAPAKAAALALAAAVRAAIVAVAPTTIHSQYLDPVAGEEYAPEVLELMEPVQFSFWHSET